jgi:hypothetical protein
MFLHLTALSFILLQHTSSTNPADVLQQTEGGSENDSKQLQQVLELN